MTPISQDRLVRTALKVILEGPGSIESRIDSVIDSLSSLSALDRRQIGRKLKTRLGRALEQKKATVKSATPLSDSIRAQIQSLAQTKGLFLFEEQSAPALLAGFSLQLGDDLTDYSLRSRIHKL